MAFVLAEWLVFPLSATRAEDVTQPPRFVTETDEPAPWTDCLWASATMFIDKRTGGQIVPNREDLRVASGDLEGGSSFPDVVRGGHALLGLDLVYSPGGGDDLSWEGLLERLATGGGAVVAGHYGSLPPHYTRWDRSFAARELAAHAVYVEQYDPATGLVWLMDPLGRGEYVGEWMRAEELSAFVFRSADGLVHAMATPPSGASNAVLRVARWAPGAVSIGAAQAGGTAGVSIWLRSRGVAPLGDLVATPHWERLDLAMPAAGAAEENRPTEAAAGVEALPEPTYIPSGEVLVGAPTAVTLSEAGLVGELILPSVPGRYRLELDLRTAGDQPAAIGPPPAVELDVLGELGARYLLPASMVADAGGQVVVDVAVTNIGTQAWEAATLTARWTTAEGTELGSGSPHAVAALSAEPGRSQLATATIDAPAEVGEYRLWVDLADPERGSLSALGVAPGVMTVWVASERLVSEPIIAGERMAPANAH